MICLDCYSESFKIEKIKICTAYNLKTVNINVNAYICQDCRLPLMDSKQMTKAIKAAKKAYEKGNGK